jgi:hypothetical protein
VAAHLFARLHVRLENVARYANVVASFDLFGSILWSFGNCRNSSSSLLTTPFHTRVDAVGEVAGSKSGR